MDREDLVSIIVPVYKVEKYMDQCIQSIINQTYGNIEIILINDGSPDTCPLKCECWKAQDERIKVIHKENGGVSDARNEGIKIATGKWLLFIDSDDVVSIYLVESLVKLSTDIKKLVVSNVVRFNNEIPLDDLVESIPQSCGKELIPKRGGMYCWGILYSRELVNRIGLLFDTSLGNIEDVVWNSIYLRYINEIIYADSPYFYRINPTSITSKCSDSRWQIASWLAARKSLMDWFCNKSLTNGQKSEVKKMFRHCQNNIYAECLAGDIPYSILRAIEKERNAKYCESFISLPERFAKNYLPRLYYLVYITLLRIKYYIVRHMREEN